MPVPLFNGMVVPLNPLPLKVRDLRLALNLIEDFEMAFRHLKPLKI
jgi:hypothetical protein